MEQKKKAIDRVEDLLEIGDFNLQDREAIKTVVDLARKCVEVEEYVNRKLSGKINETARY